MEAHALGLAPMERAHPRRLRRLVGEDRLVAAVRAGREDAFEAIFDRYQRPILSFCRHMVGSREEAEDAVQATFLSAYRDMVGSDKSLQLRPWLYAIARNQCLSLLRARREATSLEDVEPAMDGLAAEVQQREDLRSMLRDLARLPDDQRAALVLSEVGALSHEDIAEILHCQREKVKALVFQARSSLAASRAAREIPCTDIREQLATLSGGALRRGALRRHVRECDGCRQFQVEVKRQRAAMALLLPVVPSAGLKAGVLSGVHAGSAAAVGTGAGAIAGGGAVGGGFGAVLGGGAAKLLVAAAVVAGAGGSVVAVEAVDGGGGGGGSSHHATSSGAAPASSTGPSSHASSTATGDVPAGFSPTRTRGEQALGEQSPGVANGHEPKGALGHSETSPGRTQTSPGLAHTSPARASASRGRPDTTLQPHSATDRSTPTKSGGGGALNAGNASPKAGNDPAGDVPTTDDVTAQGKGVTRSVLGQ